MRPLSRIGVALLVAGSAVWAVHAVTSPVAAAPPVATPQPIKETGMKPGPVAVPGDQSAAIKDLDTQLASVRKEFHSQLDPLQAQIKTLKEKYDPQITSLEQRRKELVEQGKPIAIQQLDQQEEAEIAALAEREKNEIDQVKQRYADQRKEIHQK